MILGWLPQTSETTMQNIRKIIGRWVTRIHQELVIEPQQNKAQQNHIHIVWNILYIDGLVQGCSFCIANIMEALQLHGRIVLIEYIDGLVHDYSISIASAMEILQSCTKPSLYSMSTMFSCNCSSACKYPISDHAQMASTSIWSAYCGLTWTVTCYWLEQKR